MALPPLPRPDCLSALLSHCLPCPCPQVMPTPLTRLRWWRVCLDEAQMVESSTAKAAEMALKLQTVHRW